MHDPKSVAFEIRNPFSRRREFHGVKMPRASLVTIWHVDPETDGSDDSCGITYPKLTKAQRKSIDGLAWAEAYKPWFRKLRAKENEDVLLCESLMRAAYLKVGRAIDYKVTWDEACRWAAERVHDGIEHCRGNLCLLPGYHTNSQEDTEYWRRECANEFFCGIARRILRERRPWWRAPIFHVHHWELQLHPLQRFRRWAFSRCAECGKRFPWGYAPISHSWSGDGPRWFRGERGVYHHECHDKSMSVNGREPVEAAR